jgi:energy-converting hydrogenase Eha subunit C
MYITWLVLLLVSDTVIVTGMKSSLLNKQPSAGPEDVKICRFVNADVHLRDGGMVSQISTEYWLNVG